MEDGLPEAAVSYGVLGDKVRLKRRLLTLLAVLGIAAITAIIRNPIALLSMQNLFQARRVPLIKITFPLFSTGFPDFAQDIH